MGICKAPLNTTCVFSKALRYGNTQFYLQTSHTCLSCFFSLNYCFAAAVLIATNKVEYLLPSRITALWLVLILPSHIG